MKGLRHFKLFFAMTIVMFCLMLVVNVRPACTTQKTQNPLVLKVAIWTPAHVPYARSAIWILKEVEKRSKGRLKFEYYYSGSLIPAREALAGLKAGVADVALLPIPYFPGKLPLCTVTFLPMTGKRYYSSAMAFMELMQTPELKAELDKQNIRYLSFNTNTSYRIWLNMPVRSIADIKGKKLRTTGAHSQLMKALGAVPVSIITTETYSALERRTLDGVVFDPVAAFAYKFIEVAPNLYDMPLGNGTCFVGINKDSWNKLPSDIQQVFIDIHEEAARAGHEIYEGTAESNLKEGKAKGIIIVTEPSAEDVALVQQVAKNKVWKQWVEKMNKRGLPGQRVLDNYLKLIEKWEARSPFRK